MRRFSMLPLAAFLAWSCSDTMVPPAAPTAPRASASVTAAGLSVTVESSALSYTGFAIARVGSFPTGTQSLDLDAGTYLVAINTNTDPGTRPQFEFSVLGDGTVDYDASLDGVLSGRGSSTLTMDGVPITLDSSALSYVGHVLGGVRNEFWGIGATGLVLMPGSHHLYFNTNVPGTQPEFEYSVLGDGTVDYDASLDGVLSGRGSSTLTFDGTPIIIDSRLDGGSFLLGGVGYSPNGHSHMFTLMPGSHAFSSGDVQFDFAVLTTGTVDYDASLDGFLVGRGTATLEVNADDEGPETSAVLADPNPVMVNAPVDLSALVDDAATGGSIIASAEYSLDLGASWQSLFAEDGTFDEQAEEVVTDVSVPLSFAAPAVMDVCVRGTDAASNTGTEACVLLAVFDPTGGFATGAGWIDSPSGAHTPDDPNDPDYVGKAHFAFVSKYQKGATEPEGNASFRFKVADLDFKSTSYDWLVVNQGGTNAQFKGSGTINDEAAPTGADYRFMIWAGDHDPDTLRIKIWYEDGNEVVVYDNGSQQEIGAGQIKVHK